jgi:hypothetical protein
LSFVSTKEKPLMLIFYDCPDTALTAGIIRAGRTRNEYWNTITPISLAIGALALIYFAATFLNRPAFRLTVITALVALFLPLLPMFPPGLLLTVLYRRMTWHARNLRAYWDLAKLPMRYLEAEKETALLYTGEKYGFIKTDVLPSNAQSGDIPFLIPEGAEKTKQDWRFFGVLSSEEWPQKSKDPFVSYGLLPGPPQKLARRYAVKAYALEVLAWIVLLLGIALNIVFIFLILFSVVI